MHHEFGLPGAWGNSAGRDKASAGRGASPFYAGERVARATAIAVEIGQGQHGVSITRATFWMPPQPLQ